MYTNKSIIILMADRNNKINSNNINSLIVHNMITVRDGNLCKRTRILSTQSHWWIKNCPDLRAQVQR